ncbi:MAG: UDP-3-O-acyl-N-acetylglucosamine deacetylase, partial [Isosphaeraceae bacterium]|nr:UDP-3-O-acyl-N-acetylglucosamine deacetylase [Isosphaeraceae bacterium]
ARRLQRTIARETAVRGVGFIHGCDVAVRFRPAEADSGVVFVRTDLPDQPAVPAHIRHVIPRQRRTTIQHGAATVEMVEHVMAALAGLCIDNCLIEIDAPETPGLDGSSQAFVEALNQAGAVELDRERETLVIERPVTVREGRATLTAHPGDGEGLILGYHLDYGRHTPIGSQSYFLDISPESFRQELAPSRTFLLESEAVALRQAGIGSRASEADLLIFGPAGPIGNALRYPDECVRHKILDMVGDLALLAKDIRGHVVAHRSGHQLNAALVRKLLEAVERQGNSSGAGKSALEICDIMKILPHRYPFLLIDRVVEHQYGRRVVALKNVTVNEPFFQGHWPGRPTMPGVMIIEALAQAAGILIADRHDPGARSVLIAAIDDVKMRRPVVPGDQLFIEVVAIRLKERTAHIQASAKVGGRLVAEATIKFVVTEDEQAA